MNFLWNTDGFRRIYLFYQKRLYVNFQVWFWHVRIKVYVAQRVKDTSCCHSLSSFSHIYFIELSLIAENSNLRNLIFNAHSMMYFKSVYFRITFISLVFLRYKPTFGRKYLTCRYKVKSASLSLAPNTVVCEA